MGVNFLAKLLEIDPPPQAIPLWGQFWKTVFCQELSKMCIYVQKVMFPTPIPMGVG